jgi:hypothetical protein
MSSNQRSRRPWIIAITPQPGSPPRQYLSRRLEQDLLSVQGVHLADAAEADGARPGFGRTYGKSDPIDALAGPARRCADRTCRWLVGTTRIGSCGSWSIIESLLRQNEAG